MTERSADDIQWVKQDAFYTTAILEGQIVAAINTPRDPTKNHTISGVYTTIRVRDKFRKHPSLESAKQAILAAYLGTEEQAEDTIVTGGAFKAWAGREFLLSDEQYKLAKEGLREFCQGRFGGSVSHGADIAGRTEAAVYLTSSGMTAKGFVLRLDIEKDQVKQVPLADAPKGLIITN